MKRLYLVLLAFVMTIGLIFSMTACGSDLYEIKPDETAFLIPLTGDTSIQGKFNSEEFLKKNQVSSKRLYIDKTYSFAHGNLPDASIVIVKRTPITREWTEEQNSGTSRKNQGIVAESKESIGFLSRMNCSAQIEEDDSARFLYYYKSKTLADVIDTDIRAMIESKFVEECALLSLDEILLQKGNIMKNVKAYVIPQFKEKRGINITNLGMKGELSYLNGDIQISIDNKYKTAQDTISQKNINEKVLSKAKADAEAIKIQASTIQQSITLRQIENQKAAIDKWNGEMPQYSGTGGTIFNIPAK